MAQPFVIAYRDFGLGGKRPYLVLNLTGLNGQAGTVFGLIDTGADSTALPDGFASLLGYTPADLKSESINQAAGAANAFRALRPCTGFVPEISAIVVEFFPLFVPGMQSPLWGRADFMRRFDLTLMETLQQFSLTPVAESSAALDAQPEPATPGDVAGR